MIRTLSEILKESDATDSHNKLDNLWNEIVDTKFDRPLAHIWFAKEHIEEKHLDLFHRIRESIRNIRYR